MCEICEKVKTADRFYTPEEYLECLKYIQALVDRGVFLFKAKDCDTDKVMNESGCWIDDVISHTIKCKNCGQCFTCSCVTYHGSGSFRKDRL